jgi:hypothetical protein
MRWLFTLVVAGCAPAHAIAPLAPPTQPAPREAPPALPPHPDYAALRDFRNYYRIVKVGEYRQHWRAWFHDDEQCRAHLTAKSDGTGVEWRGYDFGFDEASHHDDVPAAQAGTAEAVRAMVEREKQVRPFAVAYDGTYREIVVEEIVPHEPDTLGRRHAATRELVLAADDALTALPQQADAMSGGDGDRVLCGRDTECSAAPYWIDVRADREGYPRLWQLEDPASDVPRSVRAAFERSVLLAAQRFVAGAPAVSVGELDVSRDPDALPADLDDSIELGLDVAFHLRPGQPGYGPLQAYMLVPLPLGAALAGEARGERELFLGGRTLGLAAALTAHADAGAHGQVDLPATLEFWVRDGVHPVHHVTTKLVIPAWIDAGRAIPTGTIRDSGLLWREVLDVRVLDGERPEISVGIHAHED